MLERETEYNQEIENLIKKVIRILNRNENLKKHWLGCEGLTTLGLANASGNHLFDDYPERFYISEQEGHCIRALFQENDYNNEEFDKYITSLINSTDICHCSFCNATARELKEEYIHSTKDENGDEIKYLAPFWRCDHCGQNWMDQIQEDELDEYLESKVVDKSYYEKIRKIKEVRKVRYTE